jgi:hypothetical protein
MKWKRKISFPSLPLCSLCLCVTILVWVSPALAASPSLFIDWAHLKNPILALPDRAVKDQCVVFDDGWFYFFLSNRFEPSDEPTFLQNFSFYRSRNLITYEPVFDRDLIVSDDGHPAFPESPDVIRAGDLWYMVFQSRRLDREHYRLYYSTSRDLLDWAPAVPIAPDNRPRERQIDGALAYQDGWFYLGYKGKQKFYVTRSRTPALDGQWLPARRASAGGKWAENFQFLNVDGDWHLLATAIFPPTVRDWGYTRYHEPFIYSMAGDPRQFEGWTAWTHMTHLRVPVEGWDPVMVANSAYLCDWRGHDGWFYLFYAGCDDDYHFQKQGYAKIGVARSRDLLTWRLPGDLSN